MGKRKKKHQCMMTASQSKYTEKYILKHNLYVNIVFYQTFRKRIRRCVLCSFPTGELCLQSQSLKMELNDLAYTVHHFISTQRIYQFIANVIYSLHADN